MKQKLLFLVAAFIFAAGSVMGQADLVSVLQLKDKNTDEVLAELVVKGLEFGPVGDTWVYTPVKGEPVIVANNAAKPVFTKTSNPTSVEKITANPFKAYISGGNLIITGDEAVKSVQIFHIGGALVLNDKSGNSNVYIGGLSSGMFVVRINDTHSVKIIK